MSKPSSVKIFNLSDIVKFGKHNGSTIEEIIKDDPNWLHWAMNTIFWFELSSTALKELPPYKELSCDNRSSHFPDEMDSEFQFMDFFGNY